MWFVLLGVMCAPLLVLFTVGLQLHLEDRRRKKLDAAHAAKKKQYEVRREALLRGLSPDTNAWTLERAKDNLLRMAKSEITEERNEGFKGLAKLPMESAARLALLRELATHPNHEVRVGAVAGLGRLDADDAVIAAIIDALEEWRGPESDYVHMMACHVLWRIGPRGKAAVPALVKRLKTPYHYVLTFGQGDPHDMAACALLMMGEEGWRALFEVMVEQEERSGEVLVNVWLGTTDAGKAEIFQWLMQRWECGAEDRRFVAAVVDAMRRKSYLERLTDKLSPELRDEVCNLPTLDSTDTAESATDARE